MNRTPVLFLNVLIIATCGLVYELLAGTLASYVLGDSVTQFSLIIGIYLSAMGVGAWLSRFIEKKIGRRFIQIEIGVALVGGLSAPLLFLSFARLSFFAVILYGTVFLIGVLVGLELPLLMRIVKDHLDFKEMVSRVLAFDYLGALVASLLFPLFLVPHVGLTRTSLLMGMLNAAVGFWGTWILKPIITGSATGLRAQAIGVIVLLGVAMLNAERLTKLAEEDLFHDPIVYATSSPYQRIVVTKRSDSFNLHLNGHLQFNSRDEYRYHEALVHPALSLTGEPKRVLILGGGDGLALREVLRWPAIDAVTLVDLDPKMTTLSKQFPPLAELNRNAFDDPRVAVVNQDAFVWLDESPGAPGFDAVIIDFPDPSTYALGKLYTTRFYRKLQTRMHADSTVAVQCTSPLVARSAFWCIIRTLEASGFAVRPYHVAVPSFGVWGFALARGGPVRMVVPWTHGFKSIKWLQKITITDDYRNNDTYAEQNNDPESYLKTAAYFDRLDAATFPAGKPVTIAGTCMVGLPGLKRVEYWLRGETGTHGRIADDDPAWKTAKWLPCAIAPPPDDWSDGLPAGVLPKNIWGFTEQDKPREWPLRYSIAHWSVTLKDLKPGGYEFRVRTVDQNGFAQPEPRPYQKSGQNAIKCKQFVVMV